MRQIRGDWDYGELPTPTPTTPNGGPRRRTWRDYVGVAVTVGLFLLLVAVVLMIGVALANAGQTAPHVSRYGLRSGDGPARLVVRNCGHAEDAWGHLRLVDFSGDTTTLRCKSRGY